MQQNYFSIGTTEGHMKWLKKHKSPLESVKEHWEATKDYRCDSNKLQQKTYDTIFQQDWPFFNSELGPRLERFMFKTIFYSYICVYIIFISQKTSFFRLI